MTAAAGTADNSTKGVIFIVIGMIALSIQDVQIKFLSSDYPLHEIVFARGLIAGCLTLFLVHIEGGLKQLISPRIRWLILRGALVVVANMCFFAAFASMRLGEAVSLFFVAPLFITVLSIPLLGERVGLQRGLAVAAGFIGVLIMTRPGGDLFSPVSLLPVGSAFLYALMQMVTRRIGLADTASVMAFYLHFCFFAVAIVIGLAIGDGRFAGTDNPSLEFLLRAWSWPQGIDAVLFVSIGVIATAGGYCISQAYRLSEAAVVAPFEYTALPFAVFWGYIIFGEVLGISTWIGIALIAGGGLFVFYRESERGRAVASKKPLRRG